MNAAFFKAHICEELEGAVDYIKRAIEIKAMEPAWGKMFMEMSSAELVHATYLYRMWGEYYNKISNSYAEMPDYLVSINDCITEEYTESSAKVKMMQEMYNK